jgi:hypothetical protein
MIALIVSFRRILISASPAASLKIIDSILQQTINLLTVDAHKQLSYFAVFNIWVLIDIDRVPSIPGIPEIKSKRNYTRNFQEFRLIAAEISSPYSGN